MIYIIAILLFILVLANDRARGLLGLLITSGVILAIAGAILFGIIILGVWIFTSDHSTNVSAPVSAPTPPFASSSENVNRQITTLVYKANNDMVLNSSRVGELKKLAGKYPYEVNFFKIPEIQLATQKVFGNELQHLRDNLQVEVPIDLTSDCLVIKGCLPHNCHDENAILVIDLASARIHGAIYENHLSTGGTQHLYVYSNAEKVSELPQVLQRWTNSKD